MSLEFNVNVPRECPKCHADRTMLDTCFALPGYAEADLKNEGGECVNPEHALPLRVAFCPRCHYLELFHDDK